MIWLSLRIKQSRQRKLPLIWRAVSILKSKFMHFWGALSKRTLPEDLERVKSIKTRFLVQNSTKIHRKSIKIVNMLEDWTQNPTKKYGEETETYSLKKSAERWSSTSFCGLSWALKHQKAHGFSNSLSRATERLNQHGSLFLVQRKGYLKTLKRCFIWPCSR